MKPKHWIGRLGAIRTTHDAGGPALGIVAGVGAAPGQALAELRVEAESFLQREAAADLKAADKKWEEDMETGPAPQRPDPLRPYRSTGIGWHPCWILGRGLLIPSLSSGSSRLWMSV